MMLLLRDDLIVETFDSPDLPPIGIEWIDVENEEYTFCDDRGQLYGGRLIRSGGLFRAEQWALDPVGEPNLQNALALVDRAVGVDPDNCGYKDLSALRAFLLRDASRGGP